MSIVSSSGTHGRHPIEVGPTDRLESRVRQFLQLGPRFRSGSAIDGTEKQSLHVVSWPDRVPSLWPGEDSAKSMKGPVDGPGHRPDPDGDWRSKRFREAVGVQREEEAPLLCKSPLTKGLVAGQGGDVHHRSVHGDPLLISVTIPNSEREKQPEEEHRTSLRRLHLFKPFRVPFGNLPFFPVRLPPALRARSPPASQTGRGSGRGCPGEIRR